ncbi:ElyC/SanA/YdcF family protein [Thiomicrolovo sp. ZZH C-3]
MFLLKKFIASFIMPLPIFLFLSAIGLYLLYTDRRRKGLQFLSVAFVWIVLLSYAPFSALLLQPLESHFPKWQPDGTPAAYVHVLGYGHDSDETLPLSSQPYPDGLVRIVEGIAVFRQNSGAKLIFSGYGGHDELSNAKVNARVAAALGVEEDNIIVLDSSRDTAEEATALKKIAGNKEVILVTSAAHMPRAIKSFENVGLNVSAAPTDFKAKDSVLLQLPGASGLSNSETAFHEYLGLLWMQIMH